MNRFIHACASAVLLVACHTASAQVSDATAESVMRDSGLWKQLEGIAPQMSAGMVATLTGDPRAAMSPMESERVARMAEQAFAAEHLRDTSRRVIAEGLRPVDLPALRAWYHSPLGQSITKMEEDSALDSREPDVAAREDAALLASLPAERRSLIAELSIVTRAAEATTDATIDTSVAIEMSAAAARPDMPHRTEREIRATLHAQRAAMLQANEANAQASFARTYAALSNEDFAKYIAFARTPAGRRASDLATRALSAAMVDAAGEFGRSLLPPADGART